MPPFPSGEISLAPCAPCAPTRCPTADEAMANAAAATDITRHFIRAKRPCADDYRWYLRRQEGASVWVVRSDQIVASDPDTKDMFFEPAEDKVYRHPTFYKLPADVDHM